MEDQYVYDDAAEQRQAEADEAVNQQKQTAKDLEKADEINVSTREKDLQIVTGQT